MPDSPSDAPSDAWSDAPSDASKHAPRTDLTLAARGEMSRFETARYWRHPAVDGVDLLRARYVTYSFAPHTHPGYAIGVIRAGVERFTYRGGTQLATPGEVVVVEPDSVHDGSAAAPDGWAYQMFYPDVDVVSEIAADVRGLRGTPHFGSAVYADERLGSLLVSAHQAADAGDRMMAGSLTWEALAHLVARHAAGTRDWPRRAVGASTVRAAQEILTADLVDAPAVPELAAAVGASPYTLVRAFRENTGLPPHRWLVQRRVESARRLLDAGEPPATAAARVGFTDQAHLTRHFKRIVGVGPGAYAAERRA